MWSLEHMSWPKEHKTLSHCDFSVEEMSNKAQWHAHGTMEKGVHHLNGTLWMSGQSAASSS